MSSSLSGCDSLQDVANGLLFTELRATDVDIEVFLFFKKEAEIIVALQSLKTFFIFQNRQTRQR